MIWEFTGGSLIAGESSIDGAIREVKEELVINLDITKGILFKSGTRNYRSIQDFNDIYVFEYNCDIKNIVLQENETCDAMWATSDKIRELLAENKFVIRDELPFYEELFDAYN